MHRTTSLIAAMAFGLGLGFAGAASAQNTQLDYNSPRNPFPHIDWSQTEQMSNNCQFGESIDSSSATDAKRRLQGAGYTDVRDLRKGCDNVWHARAQQGGFDVNVALEPSGQIFRETD